MPDHRYYLQATAEEGTAFLPFCIPKTANEERVKRRRSYLYQPA